MASTDHPRTWGSGEVKTQSDLVPRYSQTKRNISTSSVFRSRFTSRCWHWLTQPRRLLNLLTREEVVRIQSDSNIRFVCRDKSQKSYVLLIEDEDPFKTSDLWETGWDFNLCPCPWTRHKIRRRNSSRRKGKLKGLKILPHSLSHHLRNHYGNRWEILNPYRGLSSW